MDPYLPRSLVLFGTLGLLFLPRAASVLASDESRATGVGPPNHVILSDTLTGSYFVAAPLKEQYDRLLSRVETLKRELDTERVTGAQAEAQLRSLRDELQKLRENIERSKVHVPAAKVHAVRETTVFELGPERLLLITADQVKLVASEDDKVRCVLEKICLSADDKPADEELAAVKLVHRHGPAPEIVGKTEQEATTAEEEFLLSPAGRALTPEQLAARRKLIDSIRQQYAPYRDLQGKPIDTLAVEGLTYDQGNRQITLEARSGDGSRSLRSQWRRHAVLTVHVPKCRSVTVRGGLRGLDVQGVPASLVVTSSGSHDRDYNAQFRIKGVRGGLVVSDFPINLVEDVDGDVSIDSTRDFANSGTHHSNNTRVSFAYRPLECRCANLRGNLHARFGRMNVQLEEIHGRIDVQNEFGDTTLVLKQPLAAGAHRVSSASGRVEVSAEPAALGQLPVLIATSFGTIRTNTQHDQFAEFAFSSGQGVVRQWRGFRRVFSKPKEAPIGGDVLNLIDVLRANADFPGLVVQSQAGTVLFELRSQP
jgi:hypothetical protein